MRRRPRRFASSLASRIYLVGVAQFGVVAAILFLRFLFFDAPPGFPFTFTGSRFVARQLEPTLSDPSSLERKLLEVSRDLRASAVVVGPDGAIVATTPPEADPLCLPGARTPEMRANAFVCFSDTIAFPDGKVGELRLGVHGPPAPSPFFLTLVTAVALAVGGSTWLLSRSLTKPLERLSTAAKAFGAGDLNARVGLAGPHELGDVARAFDDMAERVTALRRAEKELLANVSHELRTPLARIHVAVDLATEGDANVAREALGDIAEDLAELERLVSDTLTAARLDLDKTTEGLPPLRIERIDPNRVLDRSAQRFRSSHRDRPLELQIADDLPDIDADEVLLRRAVDNLIENANAYTEDQSLAIVVRATAKDMLEIAIEDRGSGLSTDDLARVFQPFFRADRSRSRATGGLGLGLALTKRIVEAHGGTLKLDSVLGRGTIARITLPVAAPSSNPFP